ncbi:MAG TPA: DUF521 domain-containing protein [Gemmatimonadetes bacterium]|nr:DUF521 domain-containing protein [Gemmatimonadota bacterium]
MKLKLSESDSFMLAGESGPAVQMAMSILVRMSEIQGAEHLLSIVSSHIDSALYIGDSTLDYAERLVDLGAKVCVPTTLNVAGVDHHGWDRWAVPAEWAHKARRQMLAYKAMECKPTWTCAPYQTEERPSFGDQIAWGESSAVVFANSVLGARSERYPDLLDICAAITGRVPAIGLHLAENRAGQVLVRLKAISWDLLDSDEFYPVLGHQIGKLAGSRVVVLDAVGVNPSEDQLKALGAAMASSGSVALFHWVGLTPEASTIQDAFKGKAPEETIDVSLSDLAEARNDLSSCTSDRLDMVVLGSPHFSLNELKALVPLIEGRHCDSKVRFLVTTGRGVKLLAEEIGLLEVLLEFGAEITVDTCILTTPMLSSEIRSLMTNSAKYAYYAPGLLDREVVFGSTEACVESAVSGKIIKDDGLWVV